MRNQMPTDRTVNPKRLAAKTIQKTPNVVVETVDNWGAVFLNGRWWRRPVAPWLLLLPPSDSSSQCQIRAVRVLLSRVGYRAADGSFRRRLVCCRCRWLLLLLWRMVCVFILASSMLLRLLLSAESFGSPVVPCPFGVISIESAVGPSSPPLETRVGR